MPGAEFNVKKTLFTQKHFILPQVRINGRCLARRKLGLRNEKYKST